MRDVEPEERDDVERRKDGDGEQEQFGPDQERQRVVAEVCGGRARARWGGGGSELAKEGVWGFSAAFERGKSDMQSKEKRTSHVGVLRELGRPET